MPETIQTDAAPAGPGALPELPGGARTLWGLDARQLHDRYWLARGIQVLRAGEPVELLGFASMYLLIEPRALVALRAESLLRRWEGDDLRVLLARVIDRHEPGYREMAVTDGRGQFVRFERLYPGEKRRSVRIALTPSRELAAFWLTRTKPREAWRNLRQRVKKSARRAVSLHGSVARTQGGNAPIRFVRDLMQLWPEPREAARFLRAVAPDVWVDQTSRVGEGALFMGPVWVGRGRVIGHNARIVGPAPLWDQSPRVRPEPSSDHDSGAFTPPPADVPDAFQLEVTPQWSPPPPRSRVALSAKRAFDIVVALLVIALTLPIYPVILALIWLEDGRPFFFVHRRQTLGGREFGCIKFRSMRRDAEEIRKKLAAVNQADGPQFFIQEDPRLTRIGRFIRKHYLDELPQFFNVLRGDMSIVGPRPSPAKENQYCPPWREARLSVRAGITGLWQVRRNRQPGLDFQQWVQYDIEYVENASLWLDARIVFETVMLVLRKAKKS